MKNKLAKNRKSPKNEDKYINAYKSLNKSANKKNDGLDVAAVKTKDGQTGYGLMPQDLNRSHDTDYHIVKDFISTKKLKIKL